MNDSHFHESPFKTYSISTELNGGMESKKDKGKKNAGDDRFPDDCSIL